MTTGCAAARSAGRVAAARAAGPAIGAADDPGRRSAAIIPPCGLLCCFTGGLVGRRDQTVDTGIGRLAATLDTLLAASPQSRREARAAA